jgi:hypothetical protein
VINTFNRLLRKQSGQGVLAVVLVLVILAALILGPLLGFMGTGLKEGQMHESKAQRLYAADSGLEDAVNWLTHGMPTGGDWHWTWDGSTGERISYEINDMPVDVTVESLVEADTYKITSTATSPDGSTTVLSILWATTWLEGDQVFDSQNPPPSGDVHIDGDVQLSNNIEFTGNLTVTGDSTSMNNVRIIGNMGIAGNVVFENNAELTGTLCCGGDITLANGCAIYGDIRVRGNDATITLAEAGAYVEANIWADGNLTVDIETNAPIIGDIYAPNGNIDIYLRAPNAEIVGDIYAGGTIQTLVAKGTHTGTKYPAYGGPPPFPEPECPIPPEQKADMLSYEVT